MGIDGNRPGFAQPSRGREHYRTDFQRVAPKEKAEGKV